MNRRLPARVRALRISGAQSYDASMRTLITSVILVVASAAVGLAQQRSNDIHAWVAAHQPQIVKELVELLSIPNVAADRPNIRRNGEHLRAMLQRRGFAAELLETSGNPLVY